MLRRRGQMAVRPHDVTKITNRRGRVLWRDLPDPCTEGDDEIDPSGRDLGITQPLERRNSLGAPVTPEPGRGSRKWWACVPLRENAELQAASLVHSEHPTRREGASTTGNRLVDLGGHLFPAFPPRSA